jgi:phage baseplate assembly protein W
MAEINEVSLETTEGIDIEDYDDKIQAILCSIKGTIPGSRGYGIPLRGIAKPPYVAANIMAAELADVVDEYLPEIRVKGVKAEGTIDGDIDVTIQIGRRI